MVSEPTVEDTIIRGPARALRVHHGVKFKDAALVAATDLSNPLGSIPARQGHRSGRRGGIKPRGITRYRPSSTSSSASCSSRSSVALRKERDKASKERLGGLEGARRPEGKSAALASHWQREGLISGRES
jgi:hypothetical protein